MGVDTNKEKMLLEGHRNWRLISSGNDYVVTSLGRVKINGIWFDSVNYVDRIPNLKSKPYTRTMEDFTNSFVPVGILVTGFETGSVQELFNKPDSYNIVEHQDREPILWPSKYPTAEEPIQVGDEVLLKSGKIVTAETSHGAVGYFSQDRVAFLYFQHGDLKIRGASEFDGLVKQAKDFQAMYEGEVFKQDSPKALDALKFYDKYADNFQYVQNSPRDSFNWDEARAHCRATPYNPNPKLHGDVIRYSTAAFMQYIAQYFGVTVEEMKNQWRNLPGERPRCI